MTLHKPKHYRPEPGDEFVFLKDIGPQHVGRIFEAREHRTGEGVLGYLEDANHYLLDGVVAIRFYEQRLGIFERPEAMILLKAETFTHPDLTPPRPRNGMLPEEPETQVVEPVDGES